MHVWKKSGYAVSTGLLATGLRMWGLYGCSNMHWGKVLTV